MTTHKVRDELLGQHRDLRAKMTELRRIAELARAGEPTGPDLRAGIIALADALRMHNLREEQLLAEGALEGWDAARTGLMATEHVAEHQELYAALLGVPCTPREFAGAGVALLVDRMLEHMDREDAVLSGAGPVP